MLSEIFVPMMMNSFPFYFHSAATAEKPLRSYRKKKAAALCQLRTADITLTVSLQTQSAFDALFCARSVQVFLSNFCCTLQKEGAVKSAFSICLSVSES